MDHGTTALSIDQADELVRLVVTELQLAEQLTGDEWPALTPAQRLALDAFYRDALWAIGAGIAGPAKSSIETAEGAARVLKRVGLAYGLPSAESMPLPRPIRPRGR